MGAKKELALIRRELAEMQQSRGTVQLYVPQGSPIAPRSTSYLGKVFESVGLSRDLDIAHKRSEIFMMEVQAHRAGLEFNFELQMAPYRFNSQKRILDAEATTAEEIARQEHIKTLEMGYNLRLTKEEVKRAKKAGRE